MGEDWQCSGEVAVCDTELEEDGVERRQVAEIWRVSLDEVREWCDCSSRLDTAMRACMSVIVISNNRKAEHQDRGLGSKVRSNAKQTLQKHGEATL